MVSNRFDAYFVKKNWVYDERFVHIPQINDCFKELRDVLIFCRFYL